MKKFLTLLAALIVTGSMMVVQGATYTVAGSDATLLGSTWSPDNSANDLTLLDGMYVFAKQASLNAGTIEFKVCKDHGWGTAYPNDNYVLTIQENGTYWVIITYNPDDNAVKACATTTFTVAGDNTAVFGTAWTPSLAANDMVLEGGVYKFEKEEVELSAGAVLFKVCAAHGWDVAFPKDNYNLAIAESGKYTISITFDPSSCTVSAEASKTEDAVVIPTIAMHGNFTGSWADTENFAVAEGNATASLTMNIGLGNYEFGMRIGGGGNWTSNGAAFNRANPSHVVESGSGNLSFAADASGEYTFTWTFATNTLSVEYPEEPVEPEPSVTFNAGDKIYYDFTAYGQGINTMNGEYQASTDVIFSVTLGSQWIVTANTNLFKSAATADGEGIWQFVKCSTLPTEGQNMIVSTDGATYEWSTYVPTYTVAGSSAAIFSTAWDVEIEANNMTLDEGLYKFEKSNVELPSGTVAFKVVKDKDWNQAWPADNYELNIPAAGIYSIAITFDPSNTGSEVSAVATKTGDATIASSAKMIGSWNNWGEATNFTLAANELSASGTIHLNAGNYEFKIVVNDGDYRGNGYWFHREFTGVEGISSDGSNMSITADVSGDYTFTWTFATNAISIEFPELSWTEVRTGLNTSEYYTMCLNKKVVYVRGASIWRVVSKAQNGSDVILEDVEGVLDAGRPYIFYATADKLEAVYEGDAVGAPLTEGNNGLVGSFSKAQIEKDANNYIIYNNELYLVNSDNVYVGDNRAYLHMAAVPEYVSASPAPGRRRITMGVHGEQTATGVDNVQGDNVQCTKVLVNGQLFILRGEKMYDATGKLVK